MAIQKNARETIVPYLNNLWYYEKVIESRNTDIFCKMKQEGKLVNSLFQRLCSYRKRSQFVDFFRIFVTRLTRDGC